MYRGTTPTLKFDLPLDTSLMSCLFITVSQMGKTVLEKGMGDCKCDGKTVICKLTQEDTLKLDANCRAEFQVRVKTVSGDAFASRVMQKNVDDILKDGVI